MSEMKERVWKPSDDLPNEEKNQHFTVYPRAKQVSG